MSKSLISVVVCAYNEERYLSSCLTGITTQKYPKEKYELVVVDNNSTDKTAEIAKSFGARVVKETRQGNTFAVSRGTKSAIGDIIAMTDADTIVSPDWLKTIEEIFKDQNIVAATGTGDIKTRSRFFNWLSETLWETFLKFNYFLGKPHITGFNLVVRRSALEKIGGIDERFTMSPDVDLGLRISKVGKVIFTRKLKVFTSFRRWQDNPFKTFSIYFKSYIYTVWLRKPPPVKQKVIR